MSRDRKEQHRHQRDKPKDGSSGSSHSPGPSEGCSLLSCGALVENRGRLISAVPLARPQGRASPSRGRERAAVGGRQPPDTASRSAVCRPLGLRQGPGLPSVRVFPHPACPRRASRRRNRGGARKALGAASDARCTSAAPWARQLRSLRPGVVVETASQRQTNPGLDVQGKAVLGAEPPPAERRSPGVLEADAIAGNERRHRWAAVRGGHGRRFIRGRPVTF